MAVNYSPTDPTPGASRGTGVKESDRWIDYADTIADVGSRLDTLETDTGLADHLADTTDAHDASAVSITDAGGYFTGTDVEAALQELGASSGGGVTPNTARMYRAAAWTNPNTSGSNTIPFDTDSWDTGSATNTATGEFTAPATGKYRVTGRVDVGSSAATERFFVSIFVGAAEVSRGTDHTVSAASTFPSLMVSDLVSLTAAQVVTLRLRQVGGTARAISVGAHAAYMAVERVE